MSKKILIVDDDAELAEETAEILRDHGYFVENVSNSSQGEKLIKENTYDIYLFDYKMSGLTGIELLKKVKGKNSKSIVFIITGKPFIEKILKEENADNLVAGIIKKPFDIEVLLRKIKAL